MIINPTKANPFSGVFLFSSTFLGGCMSCYNCFYYSGEQIFPCAVDPITASNPQNSNSCKHYKSAYYILWSDLLIDQQFLSLDVRNLF